MSEDTKLQQLIINTLSPEQFEPITPSDTEIYLVEDDAEYATVEELATKQDVISDLATIRDGASKGATALQSITSSNVTNALGYTPYNATNPNGYTSVNESTVSGWGFTKNTGTYSKPSTGIPKTDLASAVQTSLGKADTAIQSTADCVKTSGNQTIAGVKTFTGTPVFSHADLGKSLTVMRNGAGYGGIKFANNNGDLGMYAISGDNKPAFYAGSATTGGVALVRGTTLGTAIGSTTKPVYIDANGIATAITSYEGNAATATKATQDGNGNTITSYYSPLIYNAQAFSVVGSPTITDDGVASGFSDSNYLTLSNFTLDNKKNYKIKFRYTLPTATHPNFIWVLGADYRTRPSFYVNNTEAKLFNGVSSSSSIGSSYKFVSGSTYDFICEFDKTVYKLFYKNALDNTYTQLGSNGVLPSDFSFTDLFTIGTERVGLNFNTQGSIDLKQFSITIDGQEVLSGALKGTQQLTTAGFPSDKSLALTIGASGAEYTAPADGYIYIGWYATALGGWVVPYNATIHMDGTVTRSAQGGDVWWYRSTVQVSKGDKVIISYDAAHIDFIVFVYAKGAK